MAGSKKTVWDLALEITGSDKDASAALRQVKKNIQDVQAAGKQLGKDFKEFTTNATKLVVGVAAGVTAAGAAVVGLANSFADTGDKVAKTSKALGIGVEAYQGLTYAMQQSGLSAGEFDSALEKFNLTVRQGAAGNEAARKQLEAVGLSAEKLAGMAPEQAMERLSDYLKSLPNDAERTRVAVTLFGKAAGPKMMAAMKDGSAGIRELMDEAKSLGIVLTEEEARQSELYKDAQTRLLSSFTGVKNQFIGSAIVPITEAMDMLKEAIAEQLPIISELGANFGRWLSDLVKHLPEIIAKVKDFGLWIKDSITNIKDLVGGWSNFAKVLAEIAIAPTAISGMKTIWSLGKLIKEAWKAIPLIIAKLSGTSGAGALAALGASALPVIGIIAGIAAVVYTVVKNFAELKQYALDCINRIKTSFGNATGGMTIEWQQVKEVAKTVLGVIEKGVLFAIKTVMNILTTAIQIVIGAFKVMWNVVKLILWPIETIIKVIIGLFTGGWSGAIDAIKGQFEKLGDIFAGIFGGIKIVIDAVVSFFRERFNNAIGFIGDIIGLMGGKFTAVFDGIKEKLEAFVNFFKDKIDAVKNIAAGIGGKVADTAKNVWGNITGFFTGHAEGGIFMHRHIAEIAERGAEAVVPLNNSLQGFNIWKQAGMLGGYMQREATGTSSPVMAAAASKMVSGDNVINVNMTNHFNFNGNTDSSVISQIERVGQTAGGDFKERVKSAMESIMRDQRRTTFA